MNKNNYLTPALCFIFAFLFSHSSYSLTGDDHSILPIFIGEKSELANEEQARFCWDGKCLSFSQDQLMFAKDPKSALEQLDTFFKSQTQDSSSELLIIIPKIDETKMLDWVDFLKSLAQGKFLQIQRAIVLLKNEGDSDQLKEQLSSEIDTDKMRDKIKTPLYFYLEPDEGPNRENDKDKENFHHYKNETTFNSWFENIKDESFSLIGKVSFCHFGFCKKDEVFAQEVLDPKREADILPSESQHKSDWDLYDSDPKSFKLTVPLVLEALSGFNQNFQMRNALMQLHWPDPHGMTSEQRLFAQIKLKEIRSENDLHNSSVEDRLAGWLGPANPVTNEILRQSLIDSFNGYYALVYAGEYYPYEFIDFLDGFIAEQNNWKGFAGFYCYAGNFGLPRLVQYYEITKKEDNYDIGYSLESTVANIVKKNRQNNKNSQEEKIAFDYFNSMIRNVLEHKKKYPEFVLSFYPVEWIQEDPSLFRDILFKSQDLSDRGIAYGRLLESKKTTDADFLEFAKLFKEASQLSDDDESYRSDANVVLRCILIEVLRGDQSQKFLELGHREVQEWLEKFIHSDARAAMGMLAAVSEAFSFSKNTHGIESSLWKKIFQDMGADAKEALASAIIAYSGNTAKEIDNVFEFYFPALSSEQQDKVIESWLQSDCFGSFDFLSLLNSNNPKLVDFVFQGIERRPEKLNGMAIRDLVTVYIIQFKVGAQTKIPLKRLENFFIRFQDKENMASELFDGYKLAFLDNSYSRKIDDKTLSEHLEFLLRRFDYSNFREAVEKIITQDCKEEGVSADLTCSFAWSLFVDAGKKTQPSLAVITNAFWNGARKCVAQAADVLVSCGDADGLKELKTALNFEPSKYSEAPTGERIEQIMAALSALSQIKPDTQKDFVKPIETLIVKMSQLKDEDQEYIKSYFGTLADDERVIPDIRVLFNANKK